MSTAKPTHAVAESEAQLFDCRDAYIRTLEEMASGDSRVCAVANDSVSSAKLKGFRTRFLVFAG